MNVRPRYYIRTKDNLFFAVTNYYHPTSHIVSFLRYVPCKNGNRILNKTRYKKVSSEEAYAYIRKHHPEYLFDWNVENKMMMGVLVEDIEEVYNPTAKINEIINLDNDNNLYEKIKLLAMTFHENCDISYEDMGVSGSVLIGLEDYENSDIDFIIFGIDNHKKAVEFFSNINDDPDYILDRINEKYWKQVYKKRIKDDSLSFEEFIWYENRKNNRGLIDDTLFDILLTRNFDEIDKNGLIFSRQLEKVTIKCKIIEDKYSYDTPSIYYISDVELIEGHIKNIEKILSFTHTYTGIVKNNERVIASGVCEESWNIEDDNKTYNLIIGTTRESINEYIKLEK